jgi:hypothetical protein
VRQGRASISHIYLGKLDFEVELARSPSSDLAQIVDPVCANQALNLALGCALEERERGHGRAPILAGQDGPYSNPKGK